MMRTIIASIFICLMLFSCDNGNQKKATEQLPATTQVVDETVYVYYFHTKLRCKECIAVENVTKQTVAEYFENNDKVKYIEVKIDDKADEQLIEKYRVAWNTLLITKGDKKVNITNDAFAWAENAPEVLTEQIVTEINKFLE
jgi:hypothetical protein